MFDRIIFFAIFISNQLIEEFVKHIVRSFVFCSHERQFSTIKLKF